MVEKIIVNPESIRGWGNIVMEHTVEDYSLVGSSILVDSDTVMGVESVVYTIEAEDSTISVALVSSVQSCSIGDSVVLSATVLDDEEPVEGGTVTFKLGSSTLGTDETDSDGVATYTVTASSSGSNNFTAVYESHSSNTVSVVVSKLTTSTSLSLGSSSIIVGSSTTGSATVTSAGSGVSGLTVTFYDGSTSLGTGTTNSSGVATYTLSGLSVGSHSITATVTATDTYDTSTSSASTLTVLDHSYSLAFSQSSYPASSGSATLELTLLDNSVPVSGATVSITGSDSSSYSCITNSSGVGSVTVSGVSVETTFTCSYQGVSDTCTVTVGPSYLFYDDCSVNNTSQYGSKIDVKGSTTNALTFSTDHYELAGTGSDFGGFAIPNLSNDNVKVRIKFKLTQTSNSAYNQFGLCVCSSGTPTVNSGFRVRNDKKFQKFNMNNGAESETNVYTHSNYFSSDWYYMELIHEGTSLTGKLYDKNLNQLGTYTQTITNYSNPQYIFYNLSVRGTSYATHIQEILVESL